MAINPVFIHEAGHVIAYSALGIRIVSASAWTDGLVIDHHGSVKPCEDAMFSLYSAAFTLMAGPAAQMSICEQSFDSTRNRYYSDFSKTIGFIRHNGSGLQVGGMLAKLRTVAEGCCAHWALAHKERVLNFSTALEGASVAPNFYELSGTNLEQAIESTWLGVDRKAVAEEAEALIESKIAPILQQSFTIPESWNPWLQEFVVRILRPAT